jgi:hypothetical protein
MATVYDINETNDLIKYVYPSEPILAEAASHFMADQTILVEILTELNNLTRSKSTIRVSSARLINQLVAQIILLIAKDKAAIKKYASMNVSFSTSFTIEEFLTALFGQKNYDFHFKLKLADEIKHSIVSFSYFLQKLDILKAHGLIVNFIGRNAAGLFVVVRAHKWNEFIPFVCPDNQVGMILFQVERYDHNKEVSLNFN